MVFVAANQPASHAPHQAEESAALAFLVEMLERGLDEDTERAFFNQKSGRPKLSLSAHDVALPIGAANNGPFIETQERMRNAFEERMLGEFVGRNNAGAGLVLDDREIGQCPRGAGDHAFAASDAR